MSFFAVPIVLCVAAAGFVGQFMRDFGRARHAALRSDTLDSAYMIRKVRWIRGRRRDRVKCWRPVLPIATILCEGALRRHPATSSTRFLGTVLDAGATISCVGHSQARALCNLNGVRHDLQPSSRRFKFGDVVSPAYGILTVPLPTPYRDISVAVHVMPQDFSFLIGAYALEEHS